MPAGRWLTLRVELSGSTARARVNPASEEPLTIPRLAHGRREGALGIWTYRPAYIAQLRIGPPQPLHIAPPPAQTTQWELEGYGPVTTEPHGVLCLNRYLPMSAETATLHHTFTATAETTLRFGFSDDLRLLLNGTEVFSGTNRFAGFASREARGYIEPDSHTLQVPPGTHTLTAQLAVREPFGWGLAVRFTQ